ncbi:MAG: hypothetical protein K2N71_05705 [Oscillospiraceae bacterium]|nr:hypothetical protein [Oscillospiraceae bacterium]
MKKIKSVKSILTLTSIIILAGLFAAFIISGLAGGQKESGFFLNEFATLPIKEYDEYSSVLNAETVSESYIHKPVDLRKKFAKKKYKKLFISLAEFGAMEQTSKLYNENGCYLSICYTTHFNVAENRTTDILQCFIFTKDLEEAGSILFLRNDIESMNVSINDTEIGGSSPILEALAKEKDKKYVILTNGMDTKLLDNENNLVKAGTSRHELEIVGDCYSVLEQKGLGISYNDIINEENLIWFDFNE